MSKNIEAVKRRHGIKALMKIIPDYVPKPVSVPLKMTNCGNIYRKAACKNGHIIVKRLYCHFDGCPICGKIGSEPHRKRMNSIREKVLSMEKPVYFKVKIDDVFWGKSPRKFSTDIFKMIRDRILNNFKYNTNKKFKYVMRWVFFNKDKFEPILHIIFDSSSIGVEDAERIVINTIARVLRNKFSKKIKRKDVRTFRKRVEVIFESLWVKSREKEEKFAVSGYIDYEHIEKAIESLTAPAITPEAYAKNPAVEVLTKFVNMVTFHNKVNLSGTLAEVYLKKKDEAFAKSNPALYKIYKGICPCCGEMIRWVEKLDDKQVEKEKENKEVLPVYQRDSSMIARAVESNGGKHDFYVLRERIEMPATSVLHISPKLQQWRN